MTLTGKHIGISLLVSLFGLLAMAQKTGAIKGMVTDQSDGQPVIGETITWNSMAEPMIMNSIWGFPGVTELSPAD